MSFGPANLAARFGELEQQAGPPGRYVVAFSGGLDSTVLAHALVTLRQHDDRFAQVSILAIHVDHQLHAESADWAGHCRQAAEALGIGFRALRVAVPLDSGKGPEAAARDARYQALLAELKDGDWLLSAHHREDQAETLLLNLIRGSGPAGIAGIGGLRRFGPAWLVRPLLEFHRADLLAYAESEALDWLEDPSNTDQRFDRNFLRHEVLPQLQTRWPDIAARLNRSAAHAGEASALLDELAAADLLALGDDAARLPIDGLCGLSPARQRNLIRFALRQCGLATPTTLQLEQIMTRLIPAREDAQPLVSWPGASVRRYRNGLYLLPEELADEIEIQELTGSKLELGSGLGVLCFERGAETGLSEALVERGITIRPRAGGEKFLPFGQTHTRELKKLLQEEAVVPWMRSRLPLIYCGEQLLAVGDLWLAADAVSSPGVALSWKGRPALH